MSSPEVRYHLKKPLIVYMLAACFIIAPLGNIVASMMSFGVYDWYAPHIFSRFLENVSWIDRSWLLLTLVAGVALLNQRKWSWLFGIAALLLSSVFNFHYGLKFSGSLAMGKYFFPTLFMLSNVAVVTVLYHFRFPYLDRREAWWGTYPRFACKVPLLSAGLTGMITNLSRSGAFVQGTSPVEKGKIVQVGFGPLSELNAEIVHVTENGFGLHFDPTRAQAAELKRFVRGLSVPPMGEPAIIRITAA